MPSVGDHGAARRAGDPHRFAQGLAGHGEQDPKVLITVARQVAASLPRCQAHLGPGGNLMACVYAGDILTALTSAFEQDAKGN